MVFWLIALLVFAVIVYVTRPSKRLFAIARREVDPTSEEEALQMLRRGPRYGSMGTMNTTHTFAFLWATIVIFPLACLSRAFELSDDEVGRKPKSTPASGESVTAADEPEAPSTAPTATGKPDEPAETAPDKETESETYPSVGSESVLTPNRTAKHRPRERT